MRKCSLGRHWYQKMWNFLKKFVASFPVTQTPTQMLKSGFSVLSSQEIGSRLISFQMIFESLPPELFRFQYHLLCSKILKIPEFNLIIPNIPCNSPSPVAICYLSLEFLCSGPWFTEPHISPNPIFLRSRSNFSTNILKVSPSKITTVSTPMRSLPISLNYKWYLANHIRNEILNA